ncbi:hypothetical protein GXP67_29070 [Rhodocytophaga rosea]|uniref:Lipoprotein n=1 Tax=Rhodocytophaga rosea TaxID=2704465 RepID=A0A6C0GQR5_9BACT|nr:hypothetical protein [Rhodocytophaga rosea]QHT70418.1 hypothetical protein GXP67_29070 [Rhodocytophaga rosea]
MRAVSGQLLVLFIFLTSCMDESIAEKLYSKCKEKDKCIQQVKQVTNFKWEKVYIFSVQANLEYIEKILGVPYKQWKDVGDRIIFVDKGKVVYHEEYFPYPEQIENGSTFFEINKDTYVGQYNTAVFSVEKQENDKREWYYVIKPIQ